MAEAQEAWLMPAGDAMASSIEGDVRARALAYLRGDDNLATFIDWFSDVTWALDVDDKSALGSLLLSIELAWGDWVSGHCNEGGFKASVHGALMGRR